MSRVEAAVTSHWFNAEPLVRIAVGEYCHRACEADFLHLQKRGLTRRIRIYLILNETLPLMRRRYQV